MTIFGWTLSILAVAVSAIVALNWWVDDGNPDFHSESDSNIGRTRR